MTPFELLLQAIQTKNSWRKNELVLLIATILSQANKDKQ